MERGRDGGTERGESNLEKLILPLVAYFLLS